MAREIMCARCQVLLENEKTEFIYMGCTVSQQVLRCPVCGQVFIPRELADGQMAKAEMMLEEK